VLMLITIILGLIVSCLLVPFGGFFKDRKSLVLALVPAGIFMYFLQKIPAVRSGQVLFESIDWVPALGVNLSFRLDGLSLLFALLITGIGTLIFIYASSYLKGHRFLDRFFGYLLLFMSAMLGLVLSNNVILLFLFWELTSISSYFLIGFNNDQEDSRRSALTALSLTGLGGLLLMVSLVWMGSIAGSFSFGELLVHAATIRQSPYFPAIMVLFLLGAFTKSAQYPFHFWLPGAMKAPTPVSAYLHSATMVKAGIFIMARFTPVMGGTDLWKWTLMSVGGFTMLYAAMLSLTKRDLKGILAYSTISALGILTFLIGIGTQEAIITACVFILAHALYKAPLFLVTGIVDHETGTRDITRLSGLGYTLGPVALAGGLAALSSAGLPLTLGFISKDLIYESTLHLEAKWAWYLTGLAILTNVGLVGAGLLAGFKPFIGRVREEFKHVHLPSPMMWVPPLLLAVLCVVFGLKPQWAATYLTEAAVKGVLQQYVPVELKIWHGFNQVLILSLSTFAAGLVLFIANPARVGGTRLVSFLESLRPGVVMGRIFLYIKKFAVWYTNYFHDGYLRSYIIKIILFAEVLLAYEIYRGGTFSIDISKFSRIHVYDIAILLVLLGALYKTLKTSSRLTAVVCLSVIGYAICILFVVYSAPDLAMTQFTIDTLTVVLFVLVLYRLPPFLKFRSSKVMLRDGIISVVFGVLLSIICLRVLAEPARYNISDFYAKYAYTLGKGRNVVNVILVDFRGFDTMFEIVVLSVAAIGVYSLLKLRLKSSEKE
jgi:multicomponent Na+:H+ antiporter subunit A